MSSPSESRNAVSTGEESSGSENETEPAKIFHRRVSTKKNVNNSAAIKEGYLLKQALSFQRWKKKYFRLKRNKLYYAKKPKSELFDEIELSNVCFAECSIKNVNHSFQIITPTRSLILCADSRPEMEDWLTSLKAASIQDYFEPGLDQHDIFLNYHHWYAASHARPTYCNVCREVLSGVTSHGLSCEVCKCKVHKRCASKAIANCKWTTLGSVGKDIIEEKDGSIIMPHQWMEGNLPVASVCTVCKKTCGSVLRLQDWRCLWCRLTVHTACRPNMTIICPLGPAKVSVVPPISVHSIGNDEAWDIIRPHKNFSPLLVFVNSKSGDNQGVKFLRRFKQLLNPAQVFDLISTGPSIGLRFFRHFDPFRILVCSGDGSVGWVLSEIDRFDMHKQCQVAVLPLGTGNDLARVLGWGSSCDDDAHLPQILERYETASTKMLDRWSIMVFEKAITLKTPKMSLTNAQDVFLASFIESTNLYLQSIVETDDFQIVLSSTKGLCEGVDDMLTKINENKKNDEQLNYKFDILRQKLNMLFDTLKNVQKRDYEDDELLECINELIQRINLKVIGNISQNTTPSMVTTMKKTEKDDWNSKEKKEILKIRVTEKKTLETRANSVKRAIYNIIEHSEPGRPKRYQRKFSVTPYESLKVNSNFDKIQYVSSSSLCVPPINMVSNSISSTRLTSISPFSDLKCDSIDENFLSTINLPAPKQFADCTSRRNSEISGVESSNCEVDVPSIPTTSGNETINPILEFKPNEKYESKLYNMHIKSNLKQNKNKIGHGHLLNNSNASANIQIPIIITPGMNNEENIYISENLTIIDTDLPDSVALEETIEETSDIISTISNEECSVTSEIGDNPVSSHFHIADIIQDLSSDQLTHIDSPETSEMTEITAGESLMDDISSVLGHDLIGALQDSTLTDDTMTIYSENLKSGNRLLKQRSSLQELKAMDSFEENPQQFGFENIVFEIDNRCDDQKAKEPIRFCSLAQFVEGNDIARKSFKRSNHFKNITKKTINYNNELSDNRTSDVYMNELYSKKALGRDHLEVDILGQTKSPTIIKKPEKFRTHINKIVASGISDVKRISFDESCKKESLDDEKKLPQVSVIIEPPSPIHGENLRVQRTYEIRRHSSHSPSLTVREYEKEKDRRHSGYNPNLLSLDPEHIKFLSSSPAATRRISCGSLFKPNESVGLGGSKSSLFMESSLFNFEYNEIKDDKLQNEKFLQKNKKLPIINPLVRLPTWPNVTAGFISKCLLANADTLCAAVSPLMDPDETLLEGYHEKCVMNNYFGIGIDAKISLDFHNKREEHPEKCRSRAKNYMWYGVLGSKQLLQKTYKNLEQRVQLECDGQRIPLPSLQGIVILNIPSFMGGTNFWGGHKEDDIFLAPSFDDRILEVVAVFGSVQMAASRLMNLQHHRIAQCQSVQINILGDEEVPIQVDGEAWLQPPGMIRIIHKNRVQMLCRSKTLELSLKSWQEKQRQHSISIQRDQALTSSEIITPESNDVISERERYLLLKFIETVSSLVKWVKFLIISHPSLELHLYSVACKTADTLESLHPNGKLIEEPELRVKLASVFNATKELYEDSCSLLRERSHSLILREDLENKLSAALANIEIELRKCVIQKCPNGVPKAFFNVLAPNEEIDTRKKAKPFWLRFKPTVNQSSHPKILNPHDVVTNWGVNEVVIWLETMQLDEYVDSFTKNDIRGRELLTLGRRDLKELGVIKLGHIKRILQAIKDLGDN